MFLKRREEWGLFEYSFPYKWMGNAQNVSSVTIAPTFKITMPTWSAYKDQPQTCKDTWDSMWVALRKHEEGHRKLFEQAMTNLISRLETSETTMSVRDVADLMDKASSDLQGEQDNYDTKTEHGASQGVELLISRVCKSKP